MKDRKRQMKFYNAWRNGKNRYAIFVLGITYNQKIKKFSKFVKIKS